MLQSKKHHIAGKSISGTAALQFILAQQPELAILDAELPILSAFDIIRTVREKGVETKFIVIFSERKEEQLIRFRRLKIDGVIFEIDSLKTIIACINRIEKGAAIDKRIFLSEKKKNNEEGVNNLELLSGSELKVLILIDSYKTSVIIANTLGLSVRTVEKHRSNIISKLKLKKKNNALTKWAIKNQQLIKTANLRITTHIYVIIRIVL